MMNRNHTTSTIKRALILFATTLLVIGCTPQSANNPTENSGGNGELQSNEPEQVLTVCVGEEPDTLFLYSDNLSDVGASILQAIYDGPSDRLNYAQETVLFEKMPSLADGDAGFESVMVNPGESIVNAEGEIAPLELGVSYFPSGCQSADCQQVYASRDGLAVEMDQMVVQFTILPDLLWSDGEPLSAADSVFSYEVASALRPASAEDLLDHTSSYQAPNETTIEWRGLPGYRDRDYADNFFSPLPKHQLGNMQATDLPNSQESAMTPTGWGPYAIDEIVSGESISLAKNPNYLQAEEGLPHFDRLHFRFFGKNAAAAGIEALRAGECDVLDASINLGEQTGQLKELETNGEILLFTANAGSWEHLDFGIVPVSYDDGYSQPGGDRANFFGDAHVRQGIAYCINRAAVAEEFGHASAALMQSYAPSDHTLFNPDISTYPYDPAKGAGLLESAGWVMGEAGTRAAQGIEGITDGTPFEITYFTSNSQQHEEMGQQIKEDLAACGIDVTLAAGAPEELFSGGPGGLLFGRQFDLGQFAWPLEAEPSCYLYLGEAVPGSDVELFPYGWGGWNLTGWRNSEFDAACRAAQELLPGEEGYASNHLRAQEVFANELPVIPLFAPQQVAAARPDLCGLDFDSTAGALWNIEAFGYGELCD